MSQEYQNNGKGKSSNRPQYMTVGSGSTSESAARLQAILDNDSGYGESVAGDTTVAPAWNPTLTEDRPTPAHSPMLRGVSNEASENERRLQATAIHQLWYNKHRAALGRSINSAVETLKGLQDMNTTWSATYPSVQRAEATAPKPDPRPGLTHAMSTLNGPDKAVH